MTTSKKAWGRHVSPDAATGRRGASIWMAGRSGWSPMRPDEAELGRRVRAATWQAADRAPAGDPTGRAAWERRVVALVRAKVPQALSVVPAEAIVALTHEPPPGRCSWDKYRAALADAGKQLPWPPPAGLRAALGRMCSRCRAVFEAVPIAEREAGHQADLEAAGLQASAAASVRPGQIPAARAALQAAVAPAPRPARRTPDLPPFYGSRRRS